MKTPRTLRVYLEIRRCKAGKRKQHADANLDKQGCDAAHDLIDGARDETAAPRMSTKVKCSLMGGSLRKVHVQGSRQNSDIEFRAMNRLAIDAAGGSDRLNVSDFASKEIKRTRMSDVFSVFRAGEQIRRLQHASGAVFSNAAIPNLPSVASAFGHRKPPPYVKPIARQTGASNLLVSKRRRLQWW